MTQAEIDEWLHDHIPHRIRVMLASTERLQKLTGTNEPNWPDPIVRRCWTDAVWEGRLSALRWLCEFVGVKQDNNGRPVQAKPSGRHSTDIWIDHLPNGLPVGIGSPEATTLADAWRACTQGSVHPTHGSGHPPIGDLQREEAFSVICEHLSMTIYRDKRDWMNELVLQPPKAS